MILAPAVRRGHARRRRLGSWTRPAPARPGRRSETIELSTPALVLRALLGIVVSVLLSALVAAVAWSSVPALFGLERVVIAGDSMVPSLLRGDLIYLEPGAERVAPGAVITFDSPSGSGLVTHRVVKDFGDGSLLTRGDANVMSDSDPVPVTSVRGVALVRVPVVGAIPPAGFALVGLAMLAALLALRALLRTQRRPRTWSPELRVSPSVGLAAFVVLALVGQASNAGATGLASATAANSGNSFSTVAEVTGTTSVNPRLGAVGTVVATVVFDGVIYVAGDFTTLNEVGGAAQSRRTLAAFDASTGALLGWNPVAAAAAGTGLALAVDPVQRYLYVGGSWPNFPNGGANNNERLWRFSIPAGTGSTPVAAPVSLGVRDGVVNVLVLDGDRNLYAGGTFSTVTGGPTRNRLAAWAPDGTLRSWNPGVPTANVFSLAVSGTLLYLGMDNGSIVGSGPTVSATRLAAVGTVGSVSPPPGGALTSFTPTVSNAVTGLAFDGSGRLWIGGGFGTVNGMTRSRVAVIDATTGVLSPVTANLSGSSSVALTYDPAQDLLYVGGNFTSIGGRQLVRVAAVAPATGQALRWGPDAADGEVRSIALLADGRLVVGGSFASMGSTDRQSFAIVSPPPAGSDDQLSSQVSLDVGQTGAVYGTAQSGTTLYVVGSFTWINGVQRLRAAAIDTTTGAVLPWNPQLDNTAWSVAVSGSRVYVGGDFAVVGAHSSPRPAVRLVAFDLATGAFDPAFAPAPDSRVVALELAGGRLYAAGTFNTVSGQSRSRFASLDPLTGTVDAISIAPNNSVNDIEIDGNLAYLAGVFTQVGATPRLRFAVWNLTTNSLVTTPSVPAIDMNVNTIELDTVNNRIYLGGAFTSVDTTPSTGAVSRSRIAAFDRTTFALVAGFAPNLGQVFDIEVTATGDVVAAGTFTDVGVAARDLVAAFDSAGTTLPWIATTYPGTGTVGSIRSIAADLNVAGRWWLAGDFQATIGGQARESLAQVDGPFSAAGAAGPVAFTAPTSRAEVRAQARVGDTLYLAGNFRFVAGQPRTTLAAIDLATGSLLPWAPQVLLSAGAPEASALVTNPAGTVLYAGGSFSTVDGLTRNQLAAFDVATGQVTAFNPNVSGGVVNAMLVLPGGDVVVGGGFSSIGGSARTRLARLDPSGAAHPLSVSFNNTVLAIASDAAGATLYVGGSFTGAAAATRNRAAAIDASTGTVLAWNPSVNGAVRTLLLSPDGSTVYLGGDLTAIAGGAVLRSRAAAVDTSLGSALGWDPNLNNVVRAMRFAPSGEVIVGGGFTQVTSPSSGVVTRIGLAAFDPVTAAVSSWAPAINSLTSVFTLGSTAAGALVVAGDYLSSPSSTTVGSVSLAAMPTAVAAPTLSNPRLVTVASTATSLNTVTTVGTVAHIVGSFTSMLDPATNRWEPRRRYGSFDVLTGSLGPSTVGFDTAPSVIAAAADGSQVFLGGSFTVASAAETRVLRNRAAAVSTATGQLTGWNPDANSSVAALTVDPVSGTVYLGGIFSTLAATSAIPVSRTRLAAVNPTIGAPTAWSAAGLGASGPVSALALSADRSVLYVSGSFNGLGGVIRNRLGSFTTTGTGTLTSFDPNMNGSVATLVLDETGSTLFASGDFTAVGATTRNKAAAWNVATGALTGWDPNLNNSVVSMAKLPGGAFHLGGSFTTVNGSVSRTRYAVVDANLGAVNSLNLVPNNAVLGIAYSASARRLVVVGTFVTIGGPTPTRSGVAVLS